MQFRCSTAYIWVEDRNQFLTNAQGEVIGIIGMLTDITEHKESELALIKTKKLHQDAQRIAKLGNWELDLRTNDLYWSEEIFRIFEIAPEQFVPSYEGFLNTVHPDDRELVNDAYTQHLHDQTPYQIIHRLLMPDGRIKYVQEQCETIFQEDGTPLVSQGTVQDITVLHKAKESLATLNQSLEDLIAQRTAELQTSESRFRRLFDLNVAGIIFTDFSGLITDANDYFLEMIGYSQAELEEGKINWQTLTPPEYVSQDLAVITYLKEYGSIKPWEKAYYHKQGYLVPVLLGAGLISEENGQCICFVIDMSEHKKIENQFQEAQQFLQLVLDTVPLGVFWKDRNSVYLGCNQYFANHANLPVPEAVIGKTDYELPWGDTEAGCYRKDDQQVVKTEQPKLRIEEKILLATGEQRWIETNKIPLQDLANNVIGILGTFQDIHDRKEAELQLQNLSERLTLAMQAGAIGSWEWQLDETAYWDQETLKIYGLPTDTQTVTSHQWFDCIYPEDRDRVGEKINSIIQHEQTFDFEFRIIRPDGEVRWIQDLGIVQRDETGQARRILGINRDITEQKTYENNLEYTNLELEKLLKLREETLQFREDMSNMIVHDLRNPLSSVLLATNLMQHYLECDFSIEKIYQKLAQITESGQRMQHMIDSLLIMAKLEAGKILFNPIPTDLHQLGKDIINDLELSATIHHVELQAQLPLPGQNIIIDANLLRRIIENLLTNAIKFSPPHSPVIFTLEYLPDNHLKVTVADLGSGISEENKQRIFNRFEVGELKANIPQIGLGLAFCKMAVEAQGGTLALTSNIPSGSVFTVEI